MKIFYGNFLRTDLKEEFAISQDIPEISKHFIMVNVEVKFWLMYNIKKEIEMTESKIQRWYFFLSKKKKLKQRMFVLSWFSFVRRIIQLPRSLVFYSPVFLLTATKILVLYRIIKFQATRNLIWTELTYQRSFS